VADVAGRGDSGGGAARKEASAGAERGATAGFTGAERGTSAGRATHGVAVDTRGVLVFRRAGADADEPDRAGDPGT
jgi:hypothetical protein